MFVEGWPRALEPVVESHILAAPPAVVVIDEWCGRTYWRPGLPAAVARDNTTRRARLSKGSVAEAHAFGKNYNSVAEALGPHVATSSRTVVLQFNRAVVERYGCLVKPATTSTSLASLSQEAAA